MYPTKQDGNTAMLPDVDALLSDEVLGLARYFGRYSGLLYGERNRESFLGLYAYIRRIDDLVDCSQAPDLVRNLLLGEIKTLASDCAVNHIDNFNPGYVIVEEPTNFADSEKFIPITSDQFLQIQDLRKLLQWGLSNIDDAIVPEVRYYLIEGLRGFYLENEYIDLNKPIPDVLRKYRNHRTLTVYFQIASLVLWNTELGDAKAIKEFDEFVDWAVKADILNDFISDLLHGTIVIDPKNIEQFNICLQRGEKIPEEIVEVWRSIKRDVMRESPYSLLKSFSPKFPLYAKILFLLYFSTKLVKLSLSKDPTINGQLFGSK